MNTAVKMATAELIQEAKSSDIQALVALEAQCFATDRLSKRQFQHWLKAKNRVFLVAKAGNGDLLGYGLVIMRKGTRLARLYSIALSQSARGTGLSGRLLTALEQGSVDMGKFFMRLEVANNNQAAIQLYQKQGYKVFGVYQKYYEDESDALRMQKSIRQAYSAKVTKAFPWYQQTTEFTCGPSALMMAMASMESDFQLSQLTELDIWREATTIFMTSGHGGCHPLGLALAAAKRGFEAKVYMNQQVPLFTDGVRNENNKRILNSVEEQFLEQAIQANIEVCLAELSQEDIAEVYQLGGRVLCLISTYQFNGNKVPHWVTVTGIDQQCLYLHDPDLDDDKEQAIDCQHIPIALEDFVQLSRYGKARLRTAVVLFPR